MEYKFTKTTVKLTRKHLISLFLTALDVLIMGHSEMTFIQNEDGFIKVL